MRLPFRLLTLAAAVTQGCGGSEPATGPGSMPDPGPVDVPVAVPALGTDATFDLGTWNIEWFGDPGRGPSDDTVQRWRVRDVLRGTDLDLWAVQEIADPDDFPALLAELPGFDGLLANDPSVVGGPAAYDQFDDQLRVGVVYRSSEVEVTGAQVILAEESFAFAGRPPLEVRVRVTIAGETRDACVVVLHAKAGAGAADRDRREAAAKALKAWLDENRADDLVFVAGDFNDDIDESIRVGVDTPYRVFVDDPARWTFATAAITAAGQTTIFGFPEPIDHVLASDEAAAFFEDGSARVYRVDDFIAAYENVVSDHYPVVTRWRWGG